MLQILGYYTLREIRSAHIVVIGRHPHEVAKHSVTFSKRKNVSQHNKDQTKRRRVENYERKSDAAATQKFFNSDHWMEQHKQLPGMIACHGKISKKG